VPDKSFIDNLPISIEDLSGYWTFGVKDRKPVSKELVFHKDGTITGYEHRNETRWTVSEIHELCLHDSNNKITSKFLKLANGDFLGLSTSGTQLKLTSTTHLIKLPTNSTSMHYAKAINDKGWIIGRHTYGKPNVIERESKLIIGAFCSFATGITIALGDHNTRAISTYPFSSLKWPSIEQSAKDHTTKGDVHIGNDVWVGTAAFIGSGVTIGDGAIIGAHAVVTKDIPNYGVAVGNPAKIVRYRFSDADIEKLLHIKWWDWPDEKIDRFCSFLIKNSIDELMLAHDAAERQTC